MRSGGLVTALIAIAACRATAGITSVDGMDVRVAFDDFKACGTEQKAKAEVLSNWSARTGGTAEAAGTPARTQLLMNADGTLDAKEFARLLKRRNNTEVRLVE